MVNNKHILFIVENNPVPNDPRVWGEATAAKKFGADVSVISPARKNGKKLGKTTIEGIDIYYHPRPHEGKGKIGLILEYVNAIFWEFLLCVQLFIKKPFQVIHGANPPDHIFLIALPFKLFGVSYIFDHHDIAPENYVAKFGKKGFLFNILHMMEKLTFLTAKVVVSTNESYKKIATSERGGKKNNDVYVVRNGPDLKKIPNVKPNPALRNGFKYLLGYVGVIGQQENIENLLDIMNYIVNVKNRKDIKCIVVGTGPYWQDIVDLSKQMKLEKYVEFTGFIPDDDMYEVLCSADICLNPEFSNEFTDKSTMIKIMEYMALGKPIIQHNSTEGRFSARESSLYIEKNNPKIFGDAIISLLEDSKKRKTMGIAGKKRIEEELCWEKQVVNLHSAYNRVFEKVD